MGRGSRSRAMGKHGGGAPIPPYWGMIGERVGRRFAREGQICAGMCSLTGRLPASRAKLTDSAILSFGYALRRRCGERRTGEHVPSARPIGGFASRTDRFCCSIIRVSPSAGGEAGKDCASMCSLTNRLSASRAELTGSAVPSFGRALRRR